MTVRVERTFELAVPPERVWEFIASPEQRARAISVVSEFTVNDDDGRKATWQVDLPIPLVNRTAAVKTEDVTREPPNYVKFVGRSKLMRVTGEHEIEAIDGGSRVVNRFVVDGRLPGVERYFEKNLDAELDNLEAALRSDTGTEE
jgi:carbon monoxide dehydrogenase subunit G